mgnify:CR=1 FL=1
MDGDGLKDILTLSGEPFDGNSTLSVFEGRVDGSFAAASAAINLEVLDDSTDFAGSLNAADLVGKVSGNLTGIDDAEVTDALAKGTEAFAAQRMNRGIQQALAGKKLEEV